MALSAQQQFFVEEYLRTFNATDSYMAAYPNAKRNTAASNGYRLLKENPEIIELVQVRLSEAAMSADEVLARLAEHARGDVGDFLRYEPSTDDVIVDLPKAVAAKKTRLIKKLMQKRTTRTDKDGTEIEEVVTSVEMYDAQGALGLLGKHHGLLVDRLAGADGGAIKTESTVKHDLSKLTVDELLQLRQIVSKATDAAADAG